MKRAVLLVLVGIASVQLGAALAKDVFGRADPSTLVWIRLAVSAVLLLVLTRPRVRGRSRADWAVVAGFATSLGVMNWSIYQSFALLPLGVAVTIELIGPLSVALLGSRRPRDLLWVALAAAGVLALGWERSDLDPLGVAYALLAGAGWAAYILLSAQTGRRWEALDGLTLASVLAALALAPVALTVDPGALLDGYVVLVGALIALLSSVVPYSCEMVALRTLRPAVFGILMSLEPAAAAVAALLVLGEVLSPWQWAAILCVVAASAGATWSTRPAHERDLAVVQPS